jgi:hypothetical protein
MIENIFATCSNNLYEDPELNVASTKLCIATYIINQIIENISCGQRYRELLLNYKALVIVVWQCRKILN